MPKMRFNERLVRFSPMVLNAGGENEMHIDLINDEIIMGESDGIDFLLEPKDFFTEDMITLDED